MAINPQTAVAGAGLIGNLFNVGAQALTNAKNRRWSEKMLNWEHDIRLTDWGLENEYNSPANQMKRLKEAGLNPALVYGGGASTQAGSIGGSSAPSGSAQAPKVDGLQEIIMNFQRIETMQKQRDLIQAQTEAQREHARLTGVQVGLGTQDLKQKQILAPYQVEAMVADIAKKKADISKTEADTVYTQDENERKAAMQAPTIMKALEEILSIRLQRAKTRAEIDHIRKQISVLSKDEELKQLDINLKNKGIQPGDPAWMRALAQLFSRLGGPPSKGSAVDIIGRKLGNIK